MKGGGIEIISIKVQFVIPTQLLCPKVPERSIEVGNDTIGQKHLIKVHHNN